MSTHLEQFCSNTCHTLTFHWDTHVPFAMSTSSCWAAVVVSWLPWSRELESLRHYVEQTTRYGSSRRKQRNHQEAESRHCPISNPGCFRWAHPRSAFVVAPAPNRSAPAPSPALRTPSMSPWVALFIAIL